MKNNDMFAPMTQEERDMFAPMSDEERGMGESSAPKKSLLSRIGNASAEGIVDAIKSIPEGVPGLMNVAVPAFMAAVHRPFADSDIADQKQNVENFIDKKTDEIKQKLNSTDKVKEPNKYRQLLTAYEQLKSSKSELPDTSILGDYRDMRDIAKEEIKERHDRSPIMSTVGELAGGAMTGGALMKGGKLIGEAIKSPVAAKLLLPSAEGFDSANWLARAGAAAREGTKLGAVSGLVNGKADLTKGEGWQALEDVGIGGLIGGAAGGTLSSLGSLAGSAAEALGIPQHFGFAKKTGELIDKKTIEPEVEQSAENLLGNINSVGEENAAAINWAKNIARENGITFDLQKSVDSIRQQARNIVDREQRQKFLNILDDISGNRPLFKAQEILDKKLLKNQIEGKNVEGGVDVVDNRAVGKIVNPETGKTNATVGEKLPDVDLSKASVDDTENFLNNINKYTSNNANALKDPEVVPMAQQLAGMVKSEFRGKMNPKTGNLEGGITPKNPELQDIYNQANKKQSYLLSGRERSAIPYDERSSLMNDVNEMDTVNKLQKFLMGRSGAQRADQNEVIKLFRKADENLANNYDNTREYIQKLHQIAGTDESANIMSRIGSYAVHKASLLGGIPGQLVNAGSKAAKSVGQLIQDKTPEGLKAAAQTLMNYQIHAGKNAETVANFASQLGKAAAAPESSRAAILYGLYQQPGFQQLMQSAVNKTEEDIHADDPVQALKNTASDRATDALNTVNKINPFAK